MKVTNTQTEKMLKGNQSFSQLGFSMLITRLRTTYAKNPSPSTVQDCTTQVNAFLEKFQTIMGADYTIIAKL